MRIRGLLIAAAVASAIVLGGCTAQQGPPAKPTALETVAAIDAALDRQWASTGLEGAVPRPVFETVTISDGRDGNPEMGECVSASGITAWGWGDEGFFAGSSGERGTDEQQLLFYSCFAQYPQVLVISAEQREFIYDYYAATYIPCLGMHGYEVADAPTRADFVSGAADPGINWLWSPDSALTDYPDSNEEYEEMYTDCPPTVPGIPGWSYVPQFG